MTTTATVPWQKDDQGDDVIYIPDICGPSWWAMIHAWAKAIETDGCPSCGSFAVKAVSALHDLVNVKLEKPIHDPENLAAFASLYSHAVQHIHGGQAAMNQDMALPVTISGKCSGDTEICEFKVRNTKTTEAVTGALSTLPDVVDEVRRRAEETQQLLSPASDLTFAFGSLSGTRYEFRFEIIEAASLVVSNDPFTFAPNPDYPQELQPRLRDRASLRLQVETLAADINPDLLLTDFHSLDRGAPIVGPDLVVESGNGRAMALVRATQDQPVSYGLYREALSRRAPEVGFSSSDVDVLDAPVLVRVRVTDVDRIEFVQEANLSPAISSSSIEIALTDANFITTTLLDSLVVGEGQSIDEALRSTRNTQFTSGFLAALPSQEQAKLVDGDGRLNQDGVRRITMAIFARAFPGESGLRLAEHFFESTDANVKNVFAGMLQSLGLIVQAENLAESGARDSDLAIGDDLAKAVGAFSTIKATPGMTVDSFINQGQLFERTLTPFQERVLKSLDERSRSARRIAELLRAYSNVVISQPPPAQGSLIEVVRINKDEAWGQAEQATLEPTGATLFQDDDDLFVLTEQSTGPGLTGIIPREFASLKVQTRLVRSKTYDPEASPQITQAADLQPFVRLMRDADREFLLIMYADTKNRVIGLMEANVGLRAASLVDFEAIMRGAILTGAASVFMAHNHPSGDPMPSPQDRELFRLASEKCSLFDLEFPDMLIVGKTTDYSIANEGTLPAPVGLVAQVGQDEPEIRISGKCEGDVDGSCEFRVKRAESTVKVQGIQAAIDAAKEIIDQSRISGSSGAVSGPTEVRPLTVTLAGGDFTFAPETLIDMSNVANETGKREKGFALCLGQNGLVEPGLRCLGGNCSVQIKDCLGRKQVGIFHTHPLDNPNNPAKDNALQRTFSTTDLLPIRTHRGTIECLSGPTTPVVTCAIAKPEARAVSAPKRMYPYIHPDTPEALVNQVRTTRRTPTGKVSSAQWFQPQVGEQFDFVEFDKVGAFPSVVQAHMGQEDGLSEFALSLDVGGAGEFVSERISDPGDFDAASIRTIEQGDHRIRIGCPVGNWDGSSCLVGTKGQSILHPRSEEEELIEEALRKGIAVIGEPMMAALDDLIGNAMQESDDAFALTW